MFGGKILSELPPELALWLELNDTKRVRKQLGLSISDLTSMPAPLVESLVVIQNTYEKMLLEQLHRKRYG